MEQQSNGERDNGALPEMEATPEGQRIREGIAEALRDGSTVDDETAWLIARAITQGAARSMS